ncbi:MAG TPA: pyridoxal-phosphate dependent enzyme [Mycobacterium sp.]|nr:pyridoxal-phosphate dependent enzyme [Mycobacterium sp.]
MQPIRLGTWPTPLEAAPRLAQTVGLDPADLRLKRDDLSGLGGGGNKVRKLEWTCAAAVADGARTLVTSGAAQSNHARLTAAAGARLGLDVVLVLAGAPNHAAAGNLALDGLFGAQVVWAGAVDEVQLAGRAAAIADDLRRAGAAPFLVPFGGSTPLAAEGYAECGRELLRQLPDISTVVVAVGSGATMAGLVSVLGPERVVGVHCGAISDPRTAVAGLVPRQRCVHRSWRSTPRRRAGRRGLRSAHRCGDAGDADRGADRGDSPRPYLYRSRPGWINRGRRGRRDPPGERTVLLHTGGMPGLFGHPEGVRRALIELSERSSGAASR